MIRRVVAVLLLAGLGMVFAGLFLGYSPDAALNLSADYYARNTAADTGAANIVTAIIVTYRGLDTLGEVTVLFLTAAVVALVLRRESARANPAAADHRPVGELFSAGAIPVIYSLVGLKVGAEFSSMMANLSETEDT